MREAFAEASVEEEDDEQDRAPDEKDQDVTGPMDEALAEVLAEEEDDDQDKTPDKKDQDVTGPMDEALAETLAEEDDDQDEALEGVRDLFATPEEKHEARTLNEKIKLKEEEIARNKAAQTQISKEMIELSKEGIRLKKLQIKMKKENQTEGLQEIEEKIKLLESEIKLKEEEISLNKKETEVLQGELAELKSQSGETPGEDDAEPESDTDSRSKKHSVDEDESEDEISDIDLSENEFTANIFAKLDKEFKKQVQSWDKETFKPFKKEQFINTIKFLKKKHSTLLTKDEYWKKLDDKKLKLLMNSVDQLESSSSDEEQVLLPEEQVELLMAGREDTKNKWLSRGASKEGTPDHPIYEELTKLFPIGTEMKFFGEGEVNKDNLDEIDKVSKKLSTFKLFGSNPFKNFEDEIKEAVSLNGGGIKSLRQTYIDIRKKINATLKLSKKDPKVWEDERNYDIKKYYTAWLSTVNKKFGDEIEPKDIDAGLANDEYNYLGRVESAVETLLNKIWETKFSGKETGKGKDKKFELQEKELDPKNQAIVKYFSKFLEQSDKVMKTFIQNKVKTADAGRFNAMEEKQKYGEHSDKENKDKKQTTKKAKTTAESSEVDVTAWHDLRLKGRIYSLILVQFCKSHKKTIKEGTKVKLSKLKEKISKQFLEKLESQFDTKGLVPSKASKELKKFETMLENHKEEIISATNMSNDDFDERIKKILKGRLVEKLKAEHYTLPEIE